MNAPRVFPSAELPFHLPGLFSTDWEARAANKLHSQRTLSDTDHLRDKRQRGCQAGSFQRHCSLCPAQQLQGSTAPNKHRLEHTDTFLSMRAGQKRSGSSTSARCRAKALQLSAGYSSYQIKTGLGKIHLTSEWQ